MEFVNKFNRYPDDPATDVCDCCGKTIETEYEDYYENEDSGQIMCEHCWDRYHQSWRGEITDASIL